MKINTNMKKQENIMDKQENKLKEQKIKQERRQENTLKTQIFF